MFAALKLRLALGLGATGAGERNLIPLTSTDASHPHEESSVSLCRTLILFPFGDITSVIQG